MTLAGCGSDTADELPTGPPRDIHIGLAANVDGSGDIAAEVEVVRLTGAGWLREDFDWSRIEPRPGAFEWGSYDEVVEAAAERSIHVLPILGASPCWAVPLRTPADDCSLTFPAKDSDFARFTRAAVARYGPGGSFWSARPQIDPRFAIRYWEVWNEPYLPSGAQPVSAARYASVFEAASDAGRAQSPRTKWLFASALTGTRQDGSTFDWLPAVADASPQIAENVGALSIHVYPRSDPDKPFDATRGSVAVVAAFEESFAVKKPVWITELGLSACEETEIVTPCTPGETKAQREASKARLLTEAIGQFRRTTFTDAVFVYTLREFNRAFQGEVGLIGIDGEPLPAYGAFRRAAG